MDFKQLKEVNEELFDKDSDLLRNVKFGTPWVETLILFLKKSGFKGSVSKLQIDIASSFEEIVDRNKVIFNEHFSACRLPEEKEIHIAVELLKKNNRLSHLIREKMSIDGCDFINGLSRKSHEEILKNINFEISSVVNIYYLLGFQLIDNRKEDIVYGINSDGELRKVTENVGIQSVSLSELSGNTINSFGMSNLF